MLWDTRELSGNGVQTSTLPLELSRHVISKQQPQQQQEERDFVRFIDRCVQCAHSQASTRAEEKTLKRHMHPSSPTPF